MERIIESRFYFVPNEKEKRRAGIRHVLAMTSFCRHARHLMKTEKTLQFSPHFKVLVESLCLTRDRMTALLLPPLPLFNYIQIASYVCFNFLRILPGVPSGGFKGGQRFRGGTLMSLMEGGQARSSFNYSPDE